MLLLICGFFKRICCSRRTFNQYFAAFSVNILAISYGCSSGWLAASYSELQGERTPLTTGPLSKHDLGWVAASTPLGSLLAISCLTWLADKYGRKSFLMLMAVPTFLNWLIISVATRPIHLCLARFLAGAGAGGIFAIVPVYITEIAEDRLRSTLGTFLSLGCALGFLIIILPGNYLSYIVVARIMCALPLIFAACFMLQPETPQFLAAQNSAKAEAALKYYRGIDCKAELDVELLQTLSKSTAGHANKENCSFADLLPPKARKAFFIGFGMVLLNQCSGCLTLEFYIAHIISDTGAGEVITIGGILQLVGTYAATHFVECAGRKTMLLISMVGICLGELCMSAYFYLTQLGYDTSSFSWVLTASYSLMISLACCGALTVGYVVMAEVCPPLIRSLAVRCHTFCIFLIAIISLKLFPLVVAWIGIAETIFIYFLLSFLLTIFVILFVPETKGKTLEEIQACL